MIISEDTDKSKEDYKTGLIVLGSCDRKRKNSTGEVGSHSSKEEAEN